MKLLPFALSLVLASAAVSLAGTGQSSFGLKVIAEPGTPSLDLKNVRIDPRDGKIRGTAYVNFGYAAPSSAHVHAYALNFKGAVVAKGCDRLSGNLLAPHPPLAGRGRDAFGIELKGPPSTFHSIRVVSHLGQSDCSG